jgi:voltage-gated potassium channel
VDQRTHDLPVARHYPLRHFRLNIAMLVGVVVFGTVGYMLIEGWNLLDAIFMTVITIAGVGYAEVHPLSPFGQTFTMILIASGLGIVAYTFVQFVELVVGGHLAQEWRTRQMERQIDRLKDHYIICGLGQVGEQVAEEFSRNSEPFVVVDKLERVRQICEANRWPFVQEVGTEEKALQQAGIDRAKGLIAAVHDDTTNIYIMITARALNPKLHLIARVNEVENLSLVKRAGADDIISVPRLAGKALAETAVQSCSNSSTPDLECTAVNRVLTKGDK